MITGQVVMNPNVEEAAKKLIKAAAEYWEVYQRYCSSSAVVWLQDDDGKLLVFTRGEYENTLKSFVRENLSDTFFFKQPGT